MTYPRLFLQQTADRVTEALSAPLGPVLLLTFLGACDATGPSLDLPPGAVSLAPPPVYAVWFSRTEECSGLRGEMGSIEFFFVPGATGFSTSGDELTRVGRWIKVGDRNQIIFAGAFSDHEMVVRHEMLHAILGKAGHPSDLFEERCRLTWETWGRVN